MTQRCNRHVSWDSPLYINLVTGPTSATVLRMPSTRFSKSTRLKRGCCLSLWSSAANMSSWCFSIDPEQPHEGSVMKQNHHKHTRTTDPIFSFTHQLGMGSGCDFQTFALTPQQRGFFQLLEQGCMREASPHARRTAAGKVRACSLPQSVSTAGHEQNEQKTEIPENV